MDSLKVLKYDLLKDRLYFMDYIGYWNEKYFRNGFCDGIELIVGSTK